MAQSNSMCAVEQITDARHSTHDVQGWPVRFLCCCCVTDVGQPDTKPQADMTVQTTSILRPVSDMQDIRTYTCTISMDVSNILCCGTM
jgi:hypothetical protein